MSKISIKVKVILVILISSFVLTACVSGLPTQEKYTKLIFGATAHYGNDLSKFYSIQTLSDNTLFNTEIEKQPYEKIEIKHNYNLEIKGIVFILRSSNNTIFNFKIYTDNSLILQKKYEIKQDTNISIELFFDTTKHISKNSQFYIEIIEENLQENDEKTSFMFDTLFIFFNEE